MTMLLVLIYLAFISLGLPDSLLGSVWPVMRLDLNMPLSAAGGVSMIVTGGTIVSSFLSGRVTARFGTARVTAFSVLLTAGALLGFSLSQSFLWLCLLAVPLGLGAGAVDSALNNFVALHFAARHMNWLHCFWGIGATGGPLLMSLFLGQAGGWRTGYQVIAGIQFVLTILLFLTLPAWKKAPSEAAAPEAGEAAPQQKGGLLSQPVIRATLLSFFCYCAIEMTAGLWGSSYLVQTKGLTAEAAAQGASLFYLGITLGRLLSGVFSARFSSKAFLWMGQGGILLGLVLLFLPVPPAAGTAGLLLVGLGCAPIYPSMLHDTPKKVGAERSQAMMGIQMGVAYIGNTVMPPVFGLLASVFGTALFPIYLLLLLCLMAFGIWKSYPSSLHKEK